ncbi:hypothetical protein C7212DRAFT_321642 [Tuber magnatum]|uniref:Uncharacterized protein n=1 Tax=Tuber magnatum TaxID=42249 RepID=A0A317SQ52_9PEZI|nr:hypothetical protein C7212DRAFT_321642 [Tuber magnatum]
MHAEPVRGGGLCMTFCLLALCALPLLQIYLSNDIICCYCYHDIIKRGTGMVLGRAWALPYSSAVVPFLSWNSRVPRRDLHFKDIPAAGEKSDSRNL